MSIAPITSLFFVLIPLAFIAGVIVLQIFLSKKESWWLGLLLPALSLVYSLIVVLGIAFFAPYNPANGVWPAIAQITLVFLLYNIPTALLLSIYFYFRNKRRRNGEVEKMRAQDLE